MKGGGGKEGGGLKVKRRGGNRGRNMRNLGFREGKPVETRQLLGSRTKKTIGDQRTMEWVGRGPLLETSYGSLLISLKGGTMVPGSTRRERAHVIKGSGCGGKRVDSVAPPNIRKTSWKKARAVVGSNNKTENEGEKGGRKRREGAD